ncbi:MAG: hypothetical protein AAFR84_22475 [Pseudomonadota bacterium]
MSSRGGVIDTPEALRDDLVSIVEAGHPERRHLFRFGPQTVGLHFHGSTEGHPFVNALRPAEASCSPSFAVHLIDARACGSERPRLTWTKADFGAKRTVPGWSDAALTVLYLRSHDGLALIDWARSRAILWLPSLEAIPYYELAAPLRWLFDLLAARSGLMTLHAACVGSPRCGLLIAGASGSGKSTLAITAAAEGQRYVGDDYCLVEPTDPILAHALYTTGKWQPEGTVRPADLGTHTKIERPSAKEKSIISLSLGAEDRLIGHLPLAAILIPEFTDAREPKLTRTGANRAFHALAPSTIAQSEAEAGVVAASVAALSRRLPAFRLEMPPDPRATAAALIALTDELGASAEFCS